MSFLSIKQVKKYYPRKNLPAHEALKGISFKVNKGEVLGLLGVNGAGKTTTSSIIASLIPPSSGEVLWKGKSIYLFLDQLFCLMGLYCCLRLAWNLSP